jgi:two-component system, sensor histidine kinase
MALPHASWQCAAGWARVGAMARARSGKRAVKRTHRPRQGRRRAAVPRARVIEATLAALAHDIRTSLTGILALSELLTTSELAARERGWAATVKNTADYLAMLASLIVDAARADAKGLVLRHDVFQPARLAEAIAASLSARTETKGIASEFVIAADLPPAVTGDALRLRAALENLIDNAVKFTERGTVRFDAKSQPASRRRVRLVFTVTDSGIGLSTAEIRRLFRPFEQANEEIARRYGGAGLGLAFVKRIAKAMGGDLTVASEPGRGCRFRLSVMMDKVADTAAASAQDGTAAATARAAALPPLNVLCVEDNPYGRVVLNTILSELGHHADFVGTGESAIETVARGRYDAVLMDVTLPGIDGFEATRRIRALDGPPGCIPIVGITGRASATDEATGRAAGMNGYLAKPLSPSVLAQVLGTLTSRP